VNQSPFTTYMSKIDPYNDGVPSVGESPVATMELPVSGIHGIRGQSQLEAVVSAHTNDININALACRTIEPVGEGEVEGVLVSQFRSLAQTRQTPDCIGPDNDINSDDIASNACGTV
jgi:hypothetical protein